MISRISQKAVNLLTCLATVSLSLEAVLITNFSYPSLLCLRHPMVLLAFVMVIFVLTDWHDERRNNGSGTLK